MDGTFDLTQEWNGTSAIKKNHYTQLVMDLISAASKASRCARECSISLPRSPHLRVPGLALSYPLAYGRGWPNSFSRGNWNIYFSGSCPYCWCRLKEYRKKLFVYLFLLLSKIFIFLLLPCKLKNKISQKKKKSFKQQLNRFTIVRHGAQQHFSKKKNHSILSSIYLTADGYVRTLVGYFFFPYFFHQSLTNFQN